MKSKKLKYVLIVLVVIIWGLVFYKIFTYTGTNPEINSYNTMPILSDTGHVQKDTFSLQLNYADPFLKNIKLSKYRTTVSENTNTSPNNISKNNHPKQQNYPIRNLPVKKKNLVYGGEIKNLDSEKKTGILKIENENILVHPKDIFNGITILEIFTDSIIVLEQNEKRTILKSVK